ncbi:MAG: glycosyltransferase [Syntrophaceae bacterium]|nr:glycosyltransferase [Syntrophaceae bacterium]
MIEISAIKKQWVEYKIIMTSVLIGIPVLDNIEITRACLQYLFRNTETKRLNLDVSVLIIDNGSENDIEQLLKNEFHTGDFPVYFLRNPQNLGVAPAWNQILKFSPAQDVKNDFYYDYYVISNNDALFGADWLQPMVEAMESDKKIGWISTMENGSPVLDELIEAHSLSKKYRVDPQKPYTSELITKGLDSIYEKWRGHDTFCQFIKNKNLPLFIPYKKEGRSAVCFMVRPAMIEQIGFFDEDYSPIGLAEDLEYFLRMEQILMPSWLTKDRYPAEEKWKCGFCGKSIVHHNWCSTHQGPKFDGEKWGKMREKNWKAKFGKSKKYYTALLP